MSEWTRPLLTRRACLPIMMAAMAAPWSMPAKAQNSQTSFDRWVDAFRTRARARGISDATYTRVMGNLKPDTAVFELDRKQPEFSEAALAVPQPPRLGLAASPKARRRPRNMPRCSIGWRRTTASNAAPCWGSGVSSSAFGDPIVQQNHMRPVLPALAALAWGEPRRRKYWEQELLNALIIVDRGWATPEQMRGSWAGAMGHTQWMPEVWLNIGVDYDRDGRVSPFGKPDDALAGTAQYLVKRGKWRAGEHWGYEVRAPGGGGEASRSFEAWQKAGVTRADGKPFPQPSATAKLWVPVPGGPAFLLGPNFYAVRSYNPSMNYALSIVLTGDRIMGAGPLVQQFPGGERTPTLAELQEIQKRLTALGFDTGGSDGRVGNATMIAARNFQRKVGMEPADGYAGVKLLARLRQGL